MTAAETRRAWMVRRYESGICRDCTKSRREDRAYCADCASKRLAADKRRPPKGGLARSIGPCARLGAAGTALLLTDLGHLLAQCTRTPAGCLEWNYGRDNKCYGRFTIGPKIISVHRLAWALANGGPTELDVLHRCDNPPCCDPEHLFAGTHADNMRDRSNKLRGQSKLREEDARLAKKLLRDGLSITDVARRLVVGYGVIWMIARGHNWRDVA